MVLGVGMSVVNTENPTWSVSTSWSSAVVAADLARSSLDLPPDPESLAMDPETSINTNTRALLRTSAHSDRTSRNTSGLGGFNAIVTPSAIRYGLVVVGSPGAWSEVRKKLSVQTLCCSGSCRYSRKSFAPAFLAADAQGASRMT